MMTFESFNLIKELNESHDKFNKELDSELALNEAFKSDYLRKFASQESGTRWQSGFAKDFYKHAGIKLDQITNEDFIILSNPSEWWTQKYARNDNAVGFFVDDNPEFLKQLKKKKKGKSVAGIGVILTIMRGNRGMWYGFAKDAGSSFSRYRKGSTERYGVLADEYDTASLYGWDGAKQKARITRPNLEEMATKIYVLDIDALKEKYSASELTSKRRESKAGAAALLSDKEVKAANKARYEKILQDRLDPKLMFEDVKESMTKYTNWLSNKVSEITLDGMEYENSNYFNEQKVKWGSWNESLMRPIENMWSLLNKFMNRYYDFLRDQAHVERLQEKLIKADSTEAQKIQSEIDYYAKTYNRFVKEATSYRDYVIKYKKDEDAIISK